MHTPLLGFRKILQFHAAILILAASATAAPVPVYPVSGQYCTVLAPRGWFVMSEDAPGRAFDAGFSNADGSATVYYLVRGVGNIGGVVLPGHESPESFISVMLTNGGQYPITYGVKKSLGPNMYFVPFKQELRSGFVYWTVFSPGNGMAIVTARFVEVLNRVYKQQAAEASAVARSVMCNVPSAPASAPPPSSRVTSSRNADDGGYNMWLGKETYHDPEDHKIYWMDYGTDWQNSGPEGPGYYAMKKGYAIKLAPGMQ